MEKELRLFFLAGMHSLICSPRELAPGGRFYRLPAPAYGSPECMCHRMELKYNGEIVQEAA